MLDLKGKIVLVTGASSGIGQQTAIYLSKLGARVVITGRNEERLNETYAQLAGEGNLKITADLQKPEDIKNIFIYSKQNSLKFNGLVHCAGVSCVMPIKVLAKETLQKIFDVNYFSFVDLVKEFAKKTNSENGSSIVTTSAILVKKPRPYELAYITSKAALEAAVPVMALEYKSRAFKVNAVVPGFVNTPMMQAAMQKFDNAEAMNKTAESFLYGIEKAQDIAEVIAFLISDSSKVINGRCVYADGGML